MDERGAPDLAQTQEGKHTEAGTDMGGIQRHCPCIQEWSQESSSSAGPETSQGGKG